MLFLLYVFVTIATFLTMEFVAWAAHKYLMHGMLWDWHEDHHRPHHHKHGFFEKNDRFFLVFAIPSALSYIIGSATPHFWLFFVGVGISIYGLVYFLIHDVYIHQRFKWFRQLDTRYSRAILRAHGRHHAIQTKDHCESFGLLLVHPKFFKKRTRQSAAKAAPQT